VTLDHPALLWLAVLLPVLVGLGVVGYVLRRRRALQSLGDARMMARLGAGDLRAFPTRRFVLLLIAAAGLGVAAAGPRWGVISVEDSSPSLNLVLALDVSKSMLARDADPSRLERERTLARRLLRELPSDRVGLVAFAGRAYTLSPMTVDHGALELYLDALDPGIVSYGGSSLAAALRRATDLARAPETRPGVVVLVSDGEALEEESDVLAAAQRASEQGVVVHTVGVGTSEGAPVPDLDSETGTMTGYKRGPDGEIVVSHLNESLLRRVAGRTGGRYFQLGRAGATDRLVSLLRGLDREEGAPNQRVERRTRYEWFAALALVLLMLDAILARRAETPDIESMRPGAQEEDARAVS
jgi:Ca-activated chloride channel family protein